MSQTVSSASSGTVEAVNALQRIISSPRPMPSALRSPAMWPSCGIARRDRGNALSHHAFGPTARAAATESGRAWRAARRMRSRITQPLSAGASANRSTARSASTWSRAVPRANSVSTKTPVVGTQHASGVRTRAIPCHHIASIGGFTLRYVRKAWSVTSQQ